MYILNVEKRVAATKTKQLRKEGFVPASICGGTEEDNLIIQVTGEEVRKLLKTTARGGKVEIVYEGEHINTILKEVQHDILSPQIEFLGFQRLIEGREIKGTAQIKFVNNDKMTLPINSYRRNIDYIALPCDIVETINVDLEGMTAGACIKVEDLDIAKNPKVKLLAPLGSIVLKIAGSSGAKT